MDYGRCLSAANSRCYDPWYTSTGYSASGTSTMSTYSIRDQHDYPSPTPSDPSPVSRAHQVVDSYPSSNDFPLTSFDQIDSSIGPLRSARRHISTIRQSSHNRRLSNDSSLNCSTSQIADGILPRAESPLNRYGERSSPTLPSISPSLYQPTTPVSLQSPFSPFDKGRRSRTRSASDSDHHPHSPALSTHSGQTSHSSPRVADSTARVASSRDATSTRPKRKERHHKHKLSDQDRKGICIYHQDHPNARQEDIGTVFGVERSTISKILKDKDRWLNISDDDQGNELTSKHRPSKFPEVEFEMVKCLQEWADRGESITDQLIRQRALEIARSFGMPPEKFKGSSGWIENFKHRHEIRRGEWLKARTTSHPSMPPAASAFPVASPLEPYCQQRMHSVANVSTLDSQFRTRSSAWADSTPQPGNMVIDPALQSADSSQQIMQHQPTAPIQHSPTVTYGVRYGTPLLSAREEPLPTLGQAEQALNLLLHYLDTAGQEICKPDERQVLHHLKCAMFQHASGIPYQRPT